MKKITIAATVENIETVTDFVNEQLEQLGCSLKIQMQIDVAIDEIFGNICHYAYSSGIGEATVQVETEDNPAAVIITFTDSGVMFNPLEKEDPNTALSLEEKQIGGLGIFIVKKTMDEVSYKYEDGQNKMSIKKYL